MSTTDALLKLAIQEAPGVFALLKDAFAKAHPDAPQPSNEDIIAAYEAAFSASLLRDDLWLAAHGGKS